MTCILFHADALAEFEDAVAYYNRLTPGVGDELTTAILEGLEFAAASPLTCPQVTVKSPEKSDSSFSLRHHFYPSRQCVGRRRSHAHQSQTGILAEPSSGR